MRLRTAGLFAATLLWAFVVPVGAHHSFAAEYDASKPVKLKGVITKVEWMNPHVFFFIDVEDEHGKIANWACEMGPPAGLQASGWTKNTMKFGDEVIVDGSLAKDGAKQVNARTITMALTGKRLGAASSQTARQ